MAPGKPAFGQGLMSDESQDDENGRDEIGSNV
jgi:hypothetical protein